MTRAEAMAKAEVELDAAIAQAFEQSRQSYVNGGVAPAIYQPMLEVFRAELAAWRDARLDELRRFIRYGDFDMPTMTRH